MYRWWSRHLEGSWYFSIYYVLFVYSAHNEHTVGRLSVHMFCCLWNYHTDFD